MYEWYIQLIQGEEVEGHNGDVEWDSMLAYDREDGN